MAKEIQVTMKNLDRKLAELGRMNVTTLRATYKRAFGKETGSRSRDSLRKRIEARYREVAFGSAAAGRDERLPAPGTVLSREHGGTVHEVTVLGDGFQYGGETYGSLSTVAKVITGKIWNGYVFFARALKAAQG
jgi:hypothetical protein